MEEISENKTNYLDIAPLTKWKRILTFLADFFLHFIISFFIFNGAVMPITSTIMDASERHTRSNQAAMNQFDILYRNDVMHFEKEENKYAYDNNVEFTMDCYLSYYSFYEGQVDVNHPAFGLKEENEVIRHFYFDIRDKKEDYLKLINDFNNEYHYLLIDGDSFSLVGEVKTDMNLSFFSPNDMSSKGEEYRANLENFFINLYGHVMKDIEENDLTYEGASYLANKKIVEECEKEFQKQVIISVLVSYFVSISIYYLAIPLISKNNKTLAMMMMHVDRIGTNNLYLLNKGETVISFVYAIFFNMASMFFLPVFHTEFTYLFNISFLPSVLIIGILLGLASLIMILLSSFNRAVTDYLTKSVLIRSDDLDAIYRSKGYDV